MTTAPGAARSAAATSRELAEHALRDYRELNRRLAASDPEMGLEEAFASGERWLHWWITAEAWPVTEAAAESVARLRRTIRDVPTVEAAEWITMFPRAFAVAIDRRRVHTRTAHSRRFGDRLIRPLPLQRDRDEATAVCSVRGEPSR